MKLHSLFLRTEIPHSLTPCFSGVRACQGPPPTVSSGASNAYFPQLMSVISIPDTQTALDEVVQSAWDAGLSIVDSLEKLALVRQIPALAVKLQGIEDAAILAAIARYRQGGSAAERPGHRAAGPGRPRIPRRSRSARHGSKTYRDPGRGHCTMFRARRRPPKSVRACPLRPGSPRLPELYHDPRALSETTQARASLHAKCVIVDGRIAVITSANFTEAAHTKNIEAGVLIRYEPFVQRLSVYFLALRTSNQLLRCLLS